MAIFIYHLFTSELCIRMIYTVRLKSKSGYCMFYIFQRALNHLPFERYTCLRSLLTHPQIYQISFLLNYWIIFQFFNTSIEMIPAKETQLSSITHFSPTALSQFIWKEDLCTLINVFGRRCCVQECSRNVAWREADLWLSPCFLWGRGSARVCALRKWGHISIKTMWVVHRIKNRGGKEEGKMLISMLEVYDDYKYLAITCSYKNINKIYKQTTC